ncbi:MAG: hypothetical protein FWG20_06780, partial [Candidatus Cloacimonetes bacterium]|nr:hypothetical protein [Candidatus Cloacimonadota bacterium]
SKVNEQINEQMASSSSGNKHNFERMTQNVNEIYRNSNTRGIIGLIVESWTDPVSKETHAIARMNRSENILRYNIMINENEENIATLLESANEGDLLERQQKIYFAHNIAVLTDDLHTIRSILSPAMSSMKLSYGSANAILAKYELKKDIVVSVNVTGDENNRLQKAFTNYFNGKGFKTSQTGNHNYSLRASLHTEDLTYTNTQFEYIMFTINYSFTDSNGNEIFSNTFSDRIGDLTKTQARQKVISNAEKWVTTGGFNKDFNDFFGK